MPPLSLRINARFINHSSAEKESAAAGRCVVIGQQWPSLAAAHSDSDAQDRQ